MRGTAGQEEKSWSEAESRPSPAARKPGDRHSWPAGTTPWNSSSDCWGEGGEGVCGVAYSLPTSFSKRLPKTLGSTQHEESRSGQRETERQQPSAGTGRVSLRSGT